MSTTEQPAAGSTGAAEGQNKSASSTEKTAAGSDARKPERTVPVEAVAKERAEKRAAREEAAELRQRLAELEKQIQQPIDMEALIGALGEAASTMAKAEVEAALRPVQSEVSKWRSAAKLGLSEPQADLLANVMERFPGMDEKAALAVARTEKPDLFPVQPSPFSRAVGGVIPVGGDSAFRQSSGEPDHMAKLKEARANNDDAARQHFARQEFFHRIMDSWKKSKAL